MSTVALCMIVKNEEKFIERCLRSISDYVQQIIIVDTGSTDRTVEICEQFTNDIYYYEWTNDFAAARNYALQYASTDYILQLDADETVEEMDPDVFDNLDQDGYLIKIINNLGNGLSETHLFLRLFRNKPEYRYEGMLHEQINVMKHNVTTGRLSFHINHDGYLDQVVKSKDKLKRNMEIIKWELKHNPTSFNYMNYGAQLLHEERYAEALEAFKQSYALGNQYTFTKKVIMNILKCLTRLKRFDEAIAVANDAIKLYPNSIDIRYQLGLIYMDLGYVRDAEVCFLKCRESGLLGEQTDYDYYEGTGSFLALTKLCEIYIKDNDVEKARQFLIQAIEINPDLTVLIKIFLDIHAHASRSELLTTIISLWKMDNRNLINIVAILLKLRHPVVCDFIAAYRLPVEDNVKVFCEIVNDNIGEAVGLINSCQSSNLEPSIHDIIYLAVVERDYGYITKWQEQFQLNSVEKKWLRALVTRDTPKPFVFTDKIELIWKQLLKDVLQLQQFHMVEELLVYFNHPKAKLEFAEIMISFGFNEVALDLLEESTNKSLNYKTYMTAAEALYKIGSVEDAIYYYTQAASIENKFESLYPLWKLYTEYNEDLYANQVLMMLLDLKPRSEWANQLKNN